MALITICQEMGWTYKQYMSQPTWFIDLLFEKMQIDSEQIKKS